MRRLTLFGLAVMLALGLAGAAEAASLRATVDLSDQRMYVYEHGRLIHTWAISSGRRGHRTPTGSFRPQWLSPNHRSSRYNNARMDWSVFYSGHYAVHGTTETHRLGRPASRGCVRLSNANAQRFFRLVQRHGMGATQIRVRN